MKTLFLISFLFMFSLPASALAKFSGRFFNKGCILYNYQGEEIKNFPGSICLFLDDGRVVSATDRHIRVLSPEGKSLWEKEGNFHHQLNFSLDQKNILALSSEAVAEGGTYVRYDHFLVFDFEGNIVKENSIRHLETRENLLDNRVSSVFQGLFLNTTKERSHFNSFFEIGEVKSNKDIPALRKGNYIVNSLFLGVYILSSDLKKVEHKFKIPGAHANLVHDVQVLPEGNFLIFNNESRPPDAVYPESALQILDPVTLKPLYSFSGEKGIPLYSSHCGGAQKLDDEFFLYSHMINGAYIFSRKTGKIVKSIFEPHITMGRITPVQNLRLIKLPDQFVEIHLK